MKYNNKNIITTDDITVTTLNNNLSDIINQHNDEITLLKSNVKWLYKYGGVGSGNGGSGGSMSSKAWYIIISINGNTYTAPSNEAGIPISDKLILNGEGLYTCSISVMRPNGGTFSGTLYWNNGNELMRERVTLSADNEWMSNTTMYIGGNNNISITVTDKDNTATLNLEYITTPYIFTLNLSNSDGTSVYKNNADIFMGNIKESGLKAKLTYDIGIDIAENNKGEKMGVKYTYTDILSSISSDNILNLENGSKGEIYIDLCDNALSFLTQNDNSGFYTFAITLTIEPKNGGIATLVSYSFSFNLIPSDLYLKIIPDSGIIYNMPLIVNENTYVYYTGAKSFAITPYYGQNLGREIILSIIVDGIEAQTNITVNERETIQGRNTTISIINELGETGVELHTIVFQAKAKGEAESAEFTYYMYAKDMNATLQWYPEDTDGTLVKPDYQNYWRNSKDNKNINLSNNTVLEMSASGTAIDINLSDHLSSVDTSYDILYSCGISYSEINDDDNPIFSIYNAQAKSGNDLWITAYYNKIIISSSEMGTANNTIEVYLNKTAYTDFSISNEEQFHLYTIYKRKVIDNKDTNEILYELVVYIDGVMEGSIEKWIATSTLYTNIKLYPSNYIINFIELSLYSHDIFIDSTTQKEVHTRYLNDANIVRYWYTYASNIIHKLLPDGTTGKLGLFEKYVTLSLDINSYNMPIITDSALTNLVNLAKIPIIKLNLSDNTNTIPFLEWFTRSYTSTEDDIETKNVSVYYASADSTEFVDITAPNCKFTIDIQGSTTREYRSKNLELSLVSTDTDNNALYVYSPNFKLNDSKSFLPEASFTLKADAVDSSHSNNTTMGDFINDYTIPFADALQPLAKYGKYIKNCLRGFACLVFASVKDEISGKITIYYLGVYNFNLGRKAYYNLGYYDLKLLDDVTPIDINTNVQGLQEGFHIYKLAASNTLPNLQVAEVSDNYAYFDFSLWDNSILFGPDKKSKFGMFGDFVSNSNDIDMQNSLKSMVLSVAKAGHYIFKTIGKNFGSYDDGYTSLSASGIPKNLVPDYKILYKCKVVGTNKYFEPVNPGFKQEDGTIIHLNECINTYEGNIPAVDYRSLVEYYTICMIFGLFDSVYKNLNIKTWNNKTYYISFYDMDTCLGVDNQGENSEYFAFSDYWESIEEHENNDTIKLNEVKIYRDYCPKHFNGFDAASSYLFAIAKYAKLFEKNMIADEGSTVYLDYPSLIWALLRKSKLNENKNKKEGLLCNADYFINRYFKNHLNNVDELMLNYNYRCKYFGRSTEAEKPYLFDNLNFKKFKGRRIEYVRQWLNGRFHILDAYFNLPNASIAIQRYDESTDAYINVTLDSGALIYDNTVENSDKDMNNPDIYVLHSIFGDLTRYTSDLNFTVKTLAYTPSYIIPTEDSPSIFLLSNPNSKYHISRTGVMGLNAINMGGSALWSYLENINSLNNIASINSKILTELNGTSGTVKQWDIVMPSVKIINLTSSKYTGELSITDELMGTNLNRVNVTNTGILLTIKNNWSILDIIYNSSKNGRLTIQNCTNLSNLSFNGKFQSISIDNVPRTLSFNNTLTTETTITLTANKNKDNIDITIIGDKSCTDIILNGFRNIKINNCDACKKITIEGKKTKSIEITNTFINNALTSIEADITNVTSLNISGNKNLNNLTLTKENDVNILNLTNTAIKNINWKNLPDANKLSDNILNLLPFTKLQASVIINGESVPGIQIQNNTEVTHILFPNDQQNPVYLNSSFSGCANLERVYGNLLINCTSCFHGLQKFSIHGADLSKVTYKNESVYNITNNNEIEVIPVYKLVGDTDNSYSTEALKNALYQAGNEKTNITFNTANGTSTYYKTSCTIFDIYYTFYNIGNCKNAYSMFNATIENNYTRFGSLNSFTNSPDRYMFNQCTEITKLTECFRHSCNKKRNIAIYSIYNNEPGLLTPLTKLVEWNLVFYGGYSYYIDENIFQAGVKYEDLTNIEYFDPIAIVKDINTLTSLPKTAINRNADEMVSYGKFNKFFANLPNITTLKHVFTDIDYLQWPSSSFKFPVTLSTVKKCFIAKYASNTLAFQKWWPSNNNLTEIRGSFIVTNKFSDNYLNTHTEIKNNPCNLYISDKLFNNTTKLVHIGYDINGGDFRSGLTTSTFSGNGIIKILADIDDPNNIQWPENILNNLTNLKSFSCLFANIHTNIPDIKLPGNMFKKCTQLNYASGAFYDFYANYQLTSRGFANCPNLSDVSYMFAKSTVNYSYSLTPIPYELFYTGETYTTKTFTGVNENDTNIVKDEDDKIIGCTKYNTDRIIFKNVIHNISNISHCFECNGFDTYYKLDKPQNILDGIEYNPSYSPFDYNIIEHDEENNMYIIEKNKNCNKAKYTFMWIYDGYTQLSDILNVINSHSKNNFIVTENNVSLNHFYCPDDMYVYQVVTADNMKNNNDNWNGTYSAYFMCAPDLLRYCTENCNIDYLFNLCGKSGLAEYPGLNENQNIRSYGLFGRIVPYLLQPVPKIKSIIYFMLKVKSVSSYWQISNIMEYALDNSVLPEDPLQYYIPNSFFIYAPNIDKLAYAFSNNYMALNVILNDIFIPLKLSLDINHIFYQSLLPRTLSHVFSTNIITNCSYAFAQNSSKTLGSSTEPQLRSLSVTFNQIFKLNAYNNYKGDANFLFVFNGYLGSLSNIQIEADENGEPDNRTLSDDINDYNYNIFI